MPNKTQSKPLLCEPYGKVVIHTHTPAKTQRATLVFLVIITAGLWLIPILHQRFFTNRWQCTQCGLKR